MKGMTKADLIRQYYTEDPSLIDSPANFARLLIKENPKVFKGLTDRQVSTQIRTMKRDKAFEKKDKKIDVVDDTKWTVSGGHYYWKAAKGEIHMSVEFIDQLFFEYSEHGLNLSQTKIMNKHDLKPWQWHSIKGTLMLYKQSHVFSPYTVEQTAPEDLAKMVEEKVGKVFSSVGFQVEDKYNSQLRKEYKKVIEKQTQQDLIHQTIITELQDFVQVLPKAGVQIVKKVNKDTGERIISVFVFDIHFGAESRTKDLQPFSPEILAEQFKEIAQEVNRYNAKEVHLFFGGDNIETFTGLNHPDSWKGIAKGYYGAEVIKRGYKAIVNFISLVNNVKCIYAVPGNHDRATESRAVDGEGYMAEILFELIKLSFRDAIEVKYNGRVISESVDGLQIIMTHGHEKLTNNAAELILDYGDQYKFNVLVSGHWHNRKVMKDNKNFRQLVCPSLFPGNDYSAGLGVSSAPGFIIVENNGNGKPRVHDYSL